MDFRVAFPASFDPIHRGHVDNIRNAISTFQLTSSNRLTIGIAYGHNKTRFIDTTLAGRFIEFGLPADLKALVEVQVASTRDMLRKSALDPQKRVDILTRGIRNLADAEYERTKWFTLAYAAAKEANVQPPHLMFFAATSFDFENARFSSTAVREVLTSPKPSLKQLFCLVDEPWAGVLFEASKAAPDLSSPEVTHYLSLKPDPNRPQPKPIKLFREALSRMIPGPVV